MSTTTKILGHVPFGVDQLTTGHGQRIKVKVRLQDGQFVNVFGNPGEEPMCKVERGDYVELEKPGKNYKIIGIVPHEESTTPPPPPNGKKDRKGSSATAANGRDPFAVDPDEVLKYSKMHTNLYRRIFHQVHEAFRDDHIDDGFARATTTTIYLQTVRNFHL